ncbi:MAG: DUF3299 domain-containing protein [Alphaproteobacteria bacterium]|nr:DUF3299 domain-containing protein [Alphaproteobacteria bacterium]
MPAKYVEMGKEVDVLQARLNALPMKSQEAFQDIGAQRRLKKELKENGLTADDLLPFDQDLLKKDLTSKFPDAVMIADEVDDLNARLDLLDKTPNADLNGKTIRMPGYVLPLEFDGGETTEFLLVPFVGACIHVPPPPPNQIVHVNFRRGFKSPGLYTPVYVTGRLAAIGGTVDLSLTDGQTPVETGYRLEAVSVEPYKE